MIIITNLPLTSDIESQFDDLAVNADDKVFQ